MELELLQLFGKGKFIMPGWIKHLDAVSLMWAELLPDEAFAPGNPCGRRLGWSICAALSEAAAYSHVLRLPGGSGLLRGVSFLYTKANS